MVQNPPANNIFIKSLSTFSEALSWVEHGRLGSFVHQQNVQYYKSEIEYRYMDNNLKGQLNHTHNF